MKFILASAQHCAWYSDVKAFLPCVDGEYNALRAYNSDDLQNAADWTNWGKNNNCSYVQRLEGLINQRVAQLKQPNQQKPGFWETFGQSLAQGLEDYNRQMDAQMQQQTEQYMNQYFQQKTQNKVSPPPSSNSQVQSYSRQPARTSSSGPSCAEMNAMALTACQRNNHGSLDHLESRWNALGCQPNAALDACYDRWLDKEIGEPLRKSFEQFESVNRVK